MSSTVERSPLKVIRQRCKDCVGYETTVKVYDDNGQAVLCKKKPLALCSHTWCPLWPYRSGHRPKDWSSVAVNFYISTRKDPFLEGLSKTTVHVDRDGSRRSMYEFKSRQVSPRQAIRKHCLWCSLGNANEVRSCPVKGCPSWHWRLGTPDQFKRKMTPEQTAKRRKGLDKVREISSSTGENP